MTKSDHAELYRSFNEVIRVESQAERMLVNRRMFAVLVWCFLVPAGLALVGIALILFGILPSSAKPWMNALIVVFPVSYAIYYLSTEVLREMPRVFRRGGVANTLEQFNRDMEWRARICDTMRKKVNGQSDEWSWIVQNLRIDLLALRARNRYLTALSGAVFFLILQGIDSIQDPGNLVLNRAETAITDPVQYLGLGLFLLLFYLSGSQTHQFLSRFLGCAELIYEDLRTHRRVGDENPSG